MVLFRAHTGHAGCPHHARVMAAYFQCSRLPSIYSMHTFYILIINNFVLVKHRYGNPRETILQSRQWHHQT